MTDALEAMTQARDRGEPRGAARRRRADVGAADGAARSKPRKPARRRRARAREDADEVSAGGVVFRARDGGGFDVALIRTHEGRWQLPKGWIEDGEAPEAHGAAARCAKRPASTLRSSAPLDTIEYWYKSTYDPEPARVHKFVHFFLLRYLGGSTDDHDDEVTEARWVAIDEADRMLAFKDERRMVSMAKEALRRVTAGRRAA